MIRSILLAVFFGLSLAGPLRADTLPLEVCQAFEETMPQRQAEIDALVARRAVAPIAEHARIDMAIAAAVRALDEDMRQFSEACRGRE